MIQVIIVLIHRNEYNTEKNKCLLVIILYVTIYTYFHSLVPTDPRSIDASLLHPWLRGCFKSYSLEKNIKQHEEDIHAVSINHYCK